MFARFKRIINMPFRHRISLAAIVLATIFLATACQSQHVEQESTRPAVAEKVIFLVRHAEKCLGQGDDPQLTTAGTRRANDLKRTMRDVELDAVYSTPFRRTIATAVPTAEAQSLSIIETPTAPGFLDELGETLKESAHKFVLVSGHSNTTPALVNRLAGTSLEDLPDDTYDRLYIVTLNDDNTSTVLTLGYGEDSAALTTCD